MALLRKLITIGDSKAVVIPHDYLEYYKNKGRIIKKVGMEINENIVIEPIFEDIVEPKKTPQEAPQ